MHICSEPMCCFQSNLEKQAVMDVAYYNLLVKGLYSKSRVCAYMEYHIEPVLIKPGYLQCNQNDFVFRYLQVSLSRLINIILTFCCATYR